MIASTSERPACAAVESSMEARVCSTVLRTPSTSVMPSVAGMPAARTATDEPWASVSGATPLTHTPHWSARRTLASSVPPANTSRSSSSAMMLSPICGFPSPCSLESQTITVFLPSCTWLAT